MECAFWHQILYSKVKFIFITLRYKTRSMKKSTSLYLMVFFYVATGINHFIMPSFYTAIVPHYLPFPLELVLASGIAEIVLGLLLLSERHRRTAAWFIIAML